VNQTPIQIDPPQLTAWQLMNKHNSAADTLVAATMILEALARLYEQPRGAGFNQAAEVCLRVAEAPDQHGVSELSPLLRAILRQTGNHFLECGRSLEIAALQSDSLELQNGDEAPSIDG
jgi:hypothetical protein